jgi:hypothetical protein
MSLSQIHFGFSQFCHNEIYTFQKLNVQCKTGKTYGEKEDEVWKQHSKPSSMTHEKVGIK